MNVLHRFAWAALALVAGCVPTTPQPAESAATPARPPAAQPSPAAEPARSPWSWLPVGEPEDDDEFEGEGWGFWGL